MKVTCKFFARRCLPLFAAALMLCAADRSGAQAQAPNYANSPLPALDASGQVVPQTGMRKFVDSLPGVGAGGANNLGQYLLVATPDTSTFPNSDYYEIGLDDHLEQMHSDLPPTKIRGYYQINGPDTSKRYLGATIVATRGRPVRILFRNMLPAGAGGNLFLPVDTTVMGAGDYMINFPPAPAGGMAGGTFTQNRAVLHLHGGFTPWISDGTPHQWIVPAAETGSAPYLKGISQTNVPDMWFDKTTGAIIPGGAVYPKPNTAAYANATNDPGLGSATYYYTNAQSSRLMFYHDHAYGITRLNVYAGEVAGYVIADDVPLGLNVPEPAPGVGIPLVIQDKTFVPDPATQLAAEDPSWDTTNWGGKGALWFPHVYVPNQDPTSMDGSSPMGRWDYGPWFWPIFPVDYDLPAISCVPEAFMDTPVVNGTAYPYMTVDPTQYRFRILDGCNDRYLNLQMYVADPVSVAVTNGGSGYSQPIVTFTGDATTQATGVVNANYSIASIQVGIGGGTGYTNPWIFIDDPTGSGATATATVDALGSITAINVTDGGSGYTMPVVYILDPTGAGATATATLSGTVTSINVTSPGSGYTLPPTVTITDMGGTGSGAAAIAGVNTEVKMVDACPGNWPAGWPQPDGRDGGFPDPRTRGPAFIQIATEGGLLPAPVLVRNVPIGYEYQRRSVTVLNVLEHALYLGPAERAEVVVDFTPYAGKTIILYNDAPAPNPGFDTRYDYYTGDPDQTAAGGAPTTLPGYGPNTRTVMQFRVSGTASGNPVPTDFYNGGTLTSLAGPLASAYTNGAQPPLIVSKGMPMARIGDVSLNLTGTGQGVGQVLLTAGGSGYTKAPTVRFISGGGSGAQAVAAINFAGAVTGVVVTVPGTGYTVAPNVELVNAPGAHGTGASAIASLKNSTALLPKTIQELFDPYGRMNATLGIELPFTSSLKQTTIPLGYIDPPTEILSPGETQLWKITHNGVDTHAIHFHLVNVQVINRIGWDGMVKPPYVGEEGWKETVKMNPLEDIVVAMKADVPTYVPGNPNPRPANYIPFAVPASVRPYDVTMMLGSTAGFAGIDPLTGQPTTVTNAMTNFGAEYVWHCHLLGHEENDMMRPVVVKAAIKPAAPSGLKLVGAGNQPPPATATVTSTWVDNSNGAALGFRIQRAAGLAAFVDVGSMATGTTSFGDATALTATPFRYQVIAFNSAGDSTPSNIAWAVIPDAPPGLTAKPGNTTVALSWSNVPFNQGYYVERSPDGVTGWVRVSTRPQNQTTYTDVGRSRKTKYFYRVQAFNTNLKGAANLGSPTYSPSTSAFSFVNTTTN